jgi:hypothetical protein
VIRKLSFTMLLALAACGGSGGKGDGGATGGGDLGGDLATGASADLASAGGHDLAGGGDLAAATCGAAPATYTLLTGSDAGLVRDNGTQLVWMSDSAGGGEPPQTQALATSYCQGKATSMRLPTEAEALALAAHYAACAFGHWSTWTSTATPVAGDAWVVDYTGGASPQVADNFPSAVLCVR